MAQRQPDSFLKEVFAFDKIKINSTLQDIQKDKEMAENLSFSHKEDNTVTYLLTGQKINLPGLKLLDRLLFDTLHLAFENNKLHEVFLYVPRTFKNVVFTKTLDQFNAKYGQAVIVDQKRSKSKKYVWNLGANQLTLSPYPSGLAIDYTSKFSDKKIGWIYRDRKGKGNGLIQLNLYYLEKLLREKLDIGSFEKRLPEWESAGVSNHVFYRLNFKTMVDNSPTFSISYSLKKYNVTISTEDTTSRIISGFQMEKIKDVHVWSQFENDLNKLHYAIIPKLTHGRIITYTNRAFLIFLNKEDSRISIMNKF